MLKRSLDEWVWKDEEKKLYTLKFAYKIVAEVTQLISLKNYGEQNL